MDCNEFWANLSVKLKNEKDCRTLKRSKPFKARIKDSNTVIVTPGSGDARKVTKDQFCRMWSLMKYDSRSNRYINTNKRYYDFWSSSYISALIDCVVGNQNME